MYNRYNSVFNKVFLDKDLSDLDEEQGELWWIKERVENLLEGR